MDPTPSSPTPSSVSSSGAAWGGDADPRSSAMSALLAQNWWAVALRGAFAVLFGFVALFLPGVTIASLVLLFAAYMLVDGVFAIVSAVRAAAHHERWGLLVLEGVCDIAAGAVAPPRPRLPGLTLVFFSPPPGVPPGGGVFGAGLPPPHGTRP